MIYALSVIFKVSLTLWSVINTPIPLSRSLRNNALNIGHRDGINARKRFIQQHEGRIGRKRPGNLHTPPFSSGSVYALLLRHVLDAKLGEELRMRSLDPLAAR